MSTSGVIESGFRDKCNAERHEKGRVRALLYSISSNVDIDQSISLSRGASNQRVWQTLPRHLRRRAASHDVRRVPARLRQRAKAEVSFIIAYNILQY
jgi:hypothetical protein